jgi:signal transduction histidine kinase
VRIKRGRDHLPADRIDTRPTPAAASFGAVPFVEEALRWLPADDLTHDPVLMATPLPSPRAGSEPRARVLVADDNADMREYVGRLLSTRYDVESAPDGAAALELATRAVPDLVLADVMMPNMDGFDLVRALRANEQTRGVPIVLLSARAGEEATTEGLESGADDYVVKPFSARELLARVDAQIVRGRMRAAEEAHRGYLSAVFASAPVAIAALQGPDHVFTFANTRYLAFLPHKREEDLIGRPIREALPELAGQGVFDLLDSVYRTGEPYVGRAFRVKLARGAAGALDDALFDFVYEPMRGPDGSIEGIIVVGTEVTELELARHQAEAANRAKDEFLAMLSHELRNPLAPIVTALELMSLRGSAPRERKIIDRQVRHLMRLVDDLLDVSRIARDKVALAREDLDVASVLADAIETAKPLLEHQTHRLRVNASSATLFVSGDRLRLAQVFSNLLTNAAKYTDPGGVIDVIARAEGGSAVIEVRDNGRGIDPELLPRVFDLFEQGARTMERSQGGLGLGLAIVRNLIALHGGTVTAASEGIGRGSMFTVRLPLLDHAAQIPALPSQEPPVAAPTGLRVLIVDDNRDGVEMLDEALRSMGHTTRLAYDGQEALLVASEFKPDVALVDIGLPVMDGYEVARKLRQMFDSTTELIAVTGYGQASDRARAHDAGFDAHLVKPVELAKLAQLLVRVPAPT